MFNALTLPPAELGIRSQGMGRKPRNWDWRQPAERPDSPPWTPMRQTNSQEPAWRCHKLQKIDDMFRRRQCALGNTGRLCASTNECGEQRLERYQYRMGQKVGALALSLDFLRWYCYVPSRNG